MAQIPPDTGATTPPATDPTAAQPTAPAAPQSAPAPAEPPKMEPDEETFTLTSAQLKERLERAQKTERANWLKANGFADEAAFKARMDQIAEAEKAAEEKKRAEMDELERYKTDLAAANEAKAQAEQERQAALEEAEAARTEAHLRSLCAARGIQDVDYAFYLLEKALGDLGDDEDLDEVEFLDGLMADETKKAALGIAAPEPRDGRANTAPKRNGPPPPPTGQEPFDALTATPAELAAYERQLGKA